MNSDREIDEKEMNIYWNYNNIIMNKIPVLTGVFLKIQRLLNSKERNFYLINTQTQV